MSNTPHVDKFLKALIESKQGDAFDLKSAFRVGPEDVIAGEVLQFMRDRWPDQKVGETIDGLQSAIFWVQAMASGVDIPPSASLEK